jgi:RNA polymerase primary sigma factor
MELLHTLNQREATILTLRFGLDGSEERTLEEIGDKLGVTRERIRQLQNEALSKLRRQLRTREGWPLAA